MAPWLYAGVQITVPLRLAEKIQSILDLPGLKPVDLAIEYFIRAAILKSDLRKSAAPRGTRMRPDFLLAAILLVLPLPAMAADDTASESYFPQQLTARELMQACASSTLTKTGREKRRYCHGFVSGVEESVRLVHQKASLENAFMLCAPGDKSSRDFADAYMRFAAREEVDLNRAAALVVLEALRNTYPCPPAAAK